MVGMSNIPSATLHPTEVLRRGASHAMKAMAYGLAPIFLALPPLGAALGFWQIRKAAAYGNPAVIGKIILALNILLTILEVWAIIYTAELIRTSNEQINQQMQQLQQQYPTGS